MLHHLALRITVSREETILRHKLYGVKYYMYLDNVGRPPGRGPHPVGPEDGNISDLIGASVGVLTGGYVLLCTAPPVRRAGLAASGRP